MSEASGRFTVVNQLGLHARAATKLVQTASKFPCEVEVRRGEHVHATDGEIGRVEGLIVDPSSHCVTHVLLQEGHLWGRKQVAIPIGSVEKIDRGITVQLTKHEIEALPAVRVTEHHR